VIKDRSIWLYGSHARGSVDALSDRDLLLVSDNPRELGSGLLPFSETANISQYSWQEIEGMARYGSLFLHHIRLEGMCLYEDEAVAGRLGEVLQGLGRYTRADKDLRGFRTTLNDIREGIDDDARLPFELSVLATLIRHSCVLISYLIGQSTFGRLDPVRVVASHFSLDSTITTDFPGLYCYRLLADGRARECMPLPVGLIKLWLNRADRVLEILEVQIGEFERNSGNRESNASDGKS